MKLFNFSKFDPADSLKESFASPKWLNTIKLGPSQRQLANRLISTFSCHLNIWLDKDKLGGKQTFPMTLHSLLAVAKENPDTVVLFSDFSRRQGSMVPFMTLLDFTRTICFIVSLFGDDDRESSLRDTSIFTPETRTSTDALANLRGRYLVGMVLAIIRNSSSSHLMEHEYELGRAISKQEGFTSSELNAFFSANQAAKTSGSLLKRKKKPESIGLNEFKEGLFLIFPFKSKLEDSTYLVDDVFIRSTAESANISKYKQFLALSSHAFGEVSPLEFFPTHDHVFVETVDLEFSTEFLITNLERTYPTKAASPSAKPPHFASFAEHRASQQVYMDQAKLKTKEIHDSLLN